MSFNLVAFAVESDLKPNDRLVFIALAHCANDQTSYCERTKTWRAWPSIDRIIKFTGLSASSVRRATKSLAASGLIQISSRPQSHHRNLSNVYILSCPSQPEKSAEKCIAEEVTPAEIRPINRSENNHEEGVSVKASPRREGATQTLEGVTRTPKQRIETNNNLLTPCESFDPRIPPNSVTTEAWAAYLDMLVRRGRSLPDRHQHEAQGDFLSAFDVTTQREIVQQSLRNGWLSLHPVSNNVRPFKSKNSISKPAKKPVFERLTDTSWADGLTV